jgi:hypothetical protein
MKLVINVIKSMQEVYPHIHIHIYSGNANDVTERIDKGLLNFGVLIEPTNLTKYESLCLLQQDTWGGINEKRLCVGKP